MEFGGAAACPVPFVVVVANGGGGGGRGGDDAKVTAFFMPLFIDVLTTTLQMAAAVHSDYY